MRTTHSELVRQRGEADLTIWKAAATSPKAPRTVQIRPMPARIEGRAYFGAAGLYTARTEAVVGLGVRRQSGHASRQPWHDARGDGSRTRPEEAKRLRVPSGVLSGLSTARVEPVGHGQKRRSGLARRVLARRGGSAAAGSEAGRHARRGDWRRLGGGRRSAA